jgi:hypothetical protein
VQQQRRVLANENRIHSALDGGSQEGKLETRCFGSEVSTHFNSDNTNDCGASDRFEEPTIGSVGDAVSAVPPKSVGSEESVAAQAAPRLSAEECRAAKEAALQVERDIAKRIEDAKKASLARLRATAKLKSRSRLRRLAAARTITRFGRNMRLLLIRVHAIAMAAQARASAILKLQSVARMWCAQREFAHRKHWIATSFPALVSK